MGLLAGAEVWPTTARAQSNISAAESSDVEIALLLGVEINGREQDKPKVFIRQNGNLLVPVDALREWNIPCSDLPVVEWENQKFVPVAALRGLAFKIDE